MIYYPKEFASNCLNFRQEDGYSTYRTDRTPVLLFPDNLAVIGNSLRLSYRSPCLGSVFHI